MAISIGWLWLWLVDTIMIIAITSNRRFMHCCSLYIDSWLMHFGEFTESNLMDETIMLTLTNCLTSQDITRLWPAMVSYMTEWVGHACLTCREVTNWSTRMWPMGLCNKIDIVSYRGGVKWFEWSSWMIRVEESLQLCILMKPHRLSPKKLMVGMMQHIVTFIQTLASNSIN